MESSTGEEQFSLMYIWQGSSKTFSELDLSHPIHELLCGKSIVEFPELHVVLPRDYSKYEDSVKA